MSRSLEEMRAPAKSEAPKGIMGMLDVYKDQIEKALPRHMTATRMARIAMTEIRKTPKLLQCDPKSLFGAVIQCAQLGLEPGNALGHAYLLPFDKKEKVNGQWKTVRTDVNLIIGYRGMIDLARRSGQIVSLSARAVYANDEFRYQYGLHEDLVHVPNEDNPGQLTHVYAVARLRDGGVQFDVMTLESVEKVRSQSKAKDSGPWVTHFEEMAKKTIIRRLFKYLPVSVEIQRAVGLDEMSEAGINQQNQAIVDSDWIEGFAEEVSEEPDTAQEATA